MTKASHIFTSNRLFHQLQSRYRSICAEILNDNNDSGFSSLDRDGEFQIHRKMLRRRHVRKIQKEQARRRQDEEQKSRRQDGKKHDETAIIVTDANSAPWSRRKLSRSPPQDGPLLLPSSPPPQTIPYPLLVHPTLEDKLILGRGLVPTFSPLRSRKRRSDLG